MPPTNKLVRAEGLMEPISHYVDAVVAGKTIYVSGCGATDENGKLVGHGNITAQTRKTLDNMKIALAAAGGMLDDVVKVTVYLADVNDRQKVNEVRKDYFKDNKPASTLIQVSKFALDGMLIEIEAIAVTR